LVSIIIDMEPKPYEMSRIQIFWVCLDAINYKISLCFLKNIIYLF
jgi:hypothetical protein